MAFLLLTFLFHVTTGHYFWSPDGNKELWCPYSPEDKTTEQYDFECACDAKPEWDLQNISTSYKPLFLELLDVEMIRSRVFNATYYVNNSTYFYFNFRDGNLQFLPENLCDYKTVTIDVTHNLFSEIGDLSCLTELDTLIMKHNRIGHVSNDSFAGLDKLRLVDLSFNQIEKMDPNIVSNTAILSFNFESNYMREIDITNILPVNRSICKVSYANNKHGIKIRNHENLQLGHNWDLSCADLDFSNISSINPYPLTVVSDSIHSKSLKQYVPCGIHKYEGSGFNCSCELADYFSLEFKDVKRFFSMLFSDYYCEIPESLSKIELRDVYNNRSLRDQMICDIKDGCHIRPSEGCECTCISQPTRGRLIVDCSNQSCTDLPAVVPDTKHDIELIMKHNEIRIINEKYYFARVKILDLSENPVEKINITKSEPWLKATDIYIFNHSLKTLPKNIWKLNPFVFHFGENGIPCNCDNKWIADWRRSKNTSRPLYCSNFVNKQIEDVIELLICEDKDYSLAFLLFLFVVIAGIMTFFKWFRFDLVILKRKIFNPKREQGNWTVDLFISFNDDDSEVRYFVLKLLDPFLRENRISTYIPYRDDAFGINREDAAILGMKQSKYVVIIQSADMYDTEKFTSAFIRRMEYKLAWDYYTRRHLNVKMLVIQFDSSDFDRFKYRKSRALNRFGMGFVISDTKKLWKTFLKNTISEPLCKKDNPNPNPNPNPNHVRPCKRPVCGQSGSIPSFEPFEETVCGQSDIIPSFEPFEETENETYVFK